MSWARLRRWWIITRQAFLIAYLEAQGYEVWWCPECARVLGRRLVHYRVKALDGRWVERWPAPPPPGFTCARGHAEREMERW